MLPLNHHSNFLVGRHSLLRLLISKTGHSSPWVLGWQQYAFFDVRVFHPNALSYRKSSISSIYRCHELQKKRECGDRICEVESASFTPLVFSTIGGMGSHELLSRRDALAWLHCILSFSLLRPATRCIQGSRSISFRQSDASPELGLVSGPEDY